MSRHYASPKRAEEPSEHFLLVILNFAHLEEIFSVPWGRGTSGRKWKKHRERSCLPDISVYDAILMDDNSPITKGEIKRLLQSLEKRIFQRFDSVDERFKIMHKDMDEKFKIVDESFKVVDERFKIVDEKFKVVHKDINQVLDVFIAVDKRTKRKLKNHEQRMRVIEKMLV